MAVRSIQRAKKSPSYVGVLPVPMQDLRVARALSKAIDTFEGDWEHAAEWMVTPNPALEHQRPFDLAQQATGLERVLTILGRIDHGVYS